MGIDVRELTANLHAEMEDIADDKINVFALQDTLAADVRYLYVYQNVPMAADV